LIESVLGWAGQEVDKFQVYHSNSLVQVCQQARSQYLQSLSLVRADIVQRDQRPKFLDVIVTKALRVFLLAIHRHLTSTNGFYSSPPPLSKSGLKLVCKANIVYGNLKFENSQDYAQKPQQNCTVINSASALVQLTE
jgi:hypothetical protein